MDQKIRVYPELNLAALKKGNGEIRLLAGWYELKIFDREGKAWLPIREVVEWLTLRYSRRTAYRLLREMAGSYLSLHRVKKDGTPIKVPAVRIWSLERVCFHLRVFHLTAPLLVPAERFLGLEAKKALLYASTFKTPAPPLFMVLAMVKRQGISWKQAQKAATKEYSKKPIARISIEKKTNIARSTQLRYEKVVNPKGGPPALLKNKNHAVRRNKSTGKLEKIPWQHDTQGRIVGGYGGRKANSYRSSMERGSLGAVRKVNRRFHPLVTHEARGTFKRIYFLTKRTFDKAADRSDPSFVWLDPSARLQRKRREWLIFDNEYVI